MPGRERDDSIGVVMKGKGLESCDRLERDEIEPLPPIGPATRCKEANVMRFMKGRWKLERRKKDIRHGGIINGSKL